MVKKHQKKTGDQRRLVRKKIEQDFDDLLKQVQEFVSTVDFIKLAEPNTAKRFQAW